MIGRRQAKREAKELFRACVVNSALNEAQVRQTVQQVASSGERAAPVVLEQFLRLLRLNLAEHTALIESAAPLSSELRQAAETRLKQLYGSGLTVSFSARSSLIGGMRIQIGSDVYDGTVLGALTALEQRI